jgi:hypothetical protein
MAGTEQPEQATQALLNTIQAVFGQHLGDNVVRTVYEADAAKDFTLLTDVLWELLPEVSSSSTVDHLRQLRKFVKTNRLT